MTCGHEREHTSTALWHGPPITCADLAAADPNSPERWLAELHPDPNHTLAKWACGRTSTLPLGSRVAAIRMPGSLVRSVPKGGGAPGPDLERIVDGPVLYAPDEDFYYTLTGDTYDRWRRIDHEKYSEYLTAGWVVVIPGPTQTTPPGPHWVSPVTGRLTSALMAWHFLWLGDQADQWRADVDADVCAAGWDS